MFAFKRAFRASPAAVILLCLLAGIAGLAPLAVLWNAKYVLDSIVTYLAGERTPAHFQQVLISIVLQCAIGLGSTGVSVWRQYVTNTLSVRIGFQMRREITLHCLNLDYAHFESPMFLDILTRTQGMSSSAVTGALSSGMSILTKSITIIGALLTLMHLSVLLSVLACLLSIPVYWLNTYMSRWRYELLKTQSSRARVSNYLLTLLTGRDFVKETMIFGLGKHFYGKWSTNENLSMQESIILGGKQGFIQLAGVGIGLLANAIAYLWTALLVAGKGGTIGDVTMNVGLFGNAQGQVQGLLGDLTQLYESRLYLQDYQKLMNIAPNTQRLSGLTKLHQPIRSIEFQDVSFAYPGTTRNVLEHVTLRIENGERVFLAGRNGQGKTTLIKLLLRLYDPTAGRILVNGTDIKDFEMESLRKYFGVLMQDYACYAFSVKENATLGDISHADDEARLKNSLQYTGFTDVAARLPAGLDTILGRIYGGESDLSRGEWQRLALARVLFRDASVYVFDEPTSHMDVGIERDVVAAIDDVVADKIAIIVSHRLAATTAATRVIFLDRGRVIEDGAHEELFKGSGAYAALFRGDREREDNCIMFADANPS